MKRRLDYIDCYENIWHDTHVFNQTKIKQHCKDTILLTFDGGNAR